MSDYSANEIIALNLKSKFQHVKKTTDVVNDVIVFLCDMIEDAKEFHPDITKTSIKANLAGDVICGYYCIVEKGKLPYYTVFNI